ncbi:hypothetical protein [Hymenobacter pini]|uniref:hypothetical protein n=1 Tax=Hymenobacter pini TaxID=2880879 RepID=UPI001CF34C97|nr:hypothetical protein [Hymenobacter pini]MCA8829712.1 hypothetical protein [Hymenobacter pini]
MQEPEESATIRKDLELPLGLDYARLRREGIELLQKFSGGLWTDYNDHDPGVTILESLCYALTDLTNRASQPIRHLLAPPPGTPPRPGSTLVPAHQAFSNHPVTLSDYKKILLDQEQFSGQIQSVWIAPRRGPQALVGEYVVQVGLHRNHHYPELLREALAQGHPVPDYLPTNHHELAHQILHTLNKHRGLGEQFVEVVFLKPYVISIGAHLEAAETRLHEATLADVLWHIDSFIEPDFASRGLKYLQSKGVPTEEIFAGPLLENQLLQESEFRPLRTTLAPARLNALLTPLDSIRSVSELHLYEPGHLLPSALVQVPDGHELVFDAAASLARLTLSHRGVPIRFHPEQVLHLFGQLHAARTRSLRSPIPKDKLQLPPLPGRYLDAGHYDSIQHSFPAVYGLGEGGPPAGASPAHRAQSLQLKGYLLFFEQIMANFCAQLENIEPLLSARHQSQGFFAQPLTDVPGLHEVLNDIGYEQPDDPEDEDAPALRDDAGPDAAGTGLSRHYLRKLGKLAEDPHEFMHHRDGLLSHLLARFGYTISSYQPTLTDPAAIREHRIRVRERLLQNLHTATYHRGAARVAPDDSTPDVSGLEVFVYLLTGMKYFQLVRTLNQPLRVLEQELWSGAEAAGASPAARLAVRGARLSFPDFLHVLYRQLSAPTLQPAGPDTAAVRVPASGRLPALELELLAPPVPAEAALSPQQRVLAYLRRLDERLNQFVLIDHRTLLPASFNPELEPENGEPDRTFYEFQVSVCLPDFTHQFRQTANTQYGPQFVYREYVQNLLLAYAPAHLLVHVLWLDYGQLREVETLYEGLVSASGLLANQDGHPRPDLPQWQQRLTRFLLTHLPA